MTDETLPDASRHPSDSDSRRRQRRPFHLLRDAIIIVIVALLVSFLVKSFLIKSFYIPSESMSDTLKVNDRILVNELVPDVVALNRGDVVVFKDPGGWLTPQSKPEQAPIAAGFEWMLEAVGLANTDSGEHLVKRVIGLPGDHVVCCNSQGQMSVNSAPLDEPYVRLAWGETRVSATDFDVTVPTDSLWVMGDNRGRSNDSRYQGANPGKGFVPLDDVVGRAFVVSWPAERWAWLDDYPATFGAVPLSSADR